MPVREMEGDEEGEGGCWRGLSKWSSSGTL